MTKVARGIAVLVGAFYIFVGLWAFIAPAGFFSAVASFPPYNQHLLHDAGAFQVGLGLALLLGATVRAAPQPALLAVLAASILHLAAHVEDRALGGRLTDVPALSLLCALLAVALLLELRANSRRVER